MIHTARQSVKFVKLVRAIRKTFPQLPVDHETVAVGILERLWHFAINSAKRGDIGQHDDELIAEACGWFGEPDDLLAMLAESGWIDADDTHRWVVHDWDQHAPAFVKRNIDKCGGWAKVRRDSAKYPLNCTQDTLSDHLDDPSPDLTAQNTSQVPTPNLTKPNPTQPNQSEEGGVAVDWGDVDAALQDSGMGRRFKVLDALKASGSQPAKVLQVVACWRERQALFRNPTGALHERLINEAPGLAADSGWVVDVRPRSRGQPAKDANLDYECKRAELVKTMRRQGKSEDEIEAAEKKLYAKLQGA